MLIALLDFDLVAFKSAASAEEETLDIAIYRMENLLDYILTATKADSYVAYFGSDTSFRKKIYAEYKSHRPTTKPKWLQACKDHAIEHMDVKIAPAGLEGDDMMGILSTEMNNEKAVH